MKELFRPACSSSAAQSWTSSTPTSTAAALSDACSRIAGYRVREGGAVRNTYSVRYLNHLLPFPDRVKSALAGALHATRLEDLRLSVPLGNQYVIAERPSAV